MAAKSRGTFTGPRNHRQTGAIPKTFPMGLPPNCLTRLPPQQHPSLLPPTDLGPATGGILQLLSRHGISLRHHLGKAARKTCSVLSRHSASRCPSVEVRSKWTLVPGGCGSARPHRHHRVDTRPRPRHGVCRQLSRDARALTHWAWIQGCLPTGLFLKLVGEAVQLISPAHPSRLNSHSPRGCRRCLSALQQQNCHPLASRAFCHQTALRAP